MAEAPHPFFDVSPVKSLAWGAAMLVVILAVDYVASGIIGRPWTGLRVARLVLFGVGALCIFRALEGWPLWRRILLLIGILHLDLHATTYA